MDFRKKMVLLMSLIYLMMAFIGILIIYRIVVIQYVEKQGWETLSKHLERPDRTIKPNRGNIYSSDGRLMASSIPYYYIYMDLRIEAFQAKKGKLLKDNVDTLSMQLSAKFKDKSPAAYKRMIMDAYRLQKGNLLLYKNKISYLDLQEVKQFNLFKLGKYKSGLIEKEYVSRVKPFGSLASRTIGGIFGEESKGGAYGLEKQFNAELKGEPGVAVCKRLGNIWVYVPEIEPVDGLDVVTTIDIEMQDITEKYLKQRLVEVNAESGCVVLMDVKTGEVKAISNLSRVAVGDYRESQNMAIADMSEPGSTFKVLSMMIALEDGVVKPTDSIDTGNGVYAMHGLNMTDHNKNRGGYGRLSVEDVIAFSSNIGVARIIDENYGKNPSKFVDAIRKTKITEKLNVGLPGEAIPNIPHPKTDAKKWYKALLPWMSVGYNTQMPPIYTLAFFNAIANDGKLVKPYFVKEVVKNGQVIESFSPTTINSSICSDRTLDQLHSMLRRVVEKGTGAIVNSDKVAIAGKSSTAQLNYTRGRAKSHQVGFCGYFPADNPQFSAIVIVKNPDPTKAYASGGLISGVVFKNIAERVYARHVKVPSNDLVFDQFPKEPVVKDGLFEPLERVCGSLKIPVHNDQGASWVRANSKREAIVTREAQQYKDAVPNVMNMGAKDAVFLLEEAGYRVQMQGRGSVVSQSVSPGVPHPKGSVVTIVLDL